MVATLKTRVLSREEKGIGPVSMKRLIFSGMGAGIVFMIVRVTPLNLCGIPALLVGFVFFLVMSGDKQGVPRYRYLWMTWRGNFILGAARGGWSARIANWFSLDVAVTRLYGSTLFSAAPQGDAVSDWDWEIVEDPFAVDEGLRLVRDVPLLLDLPTQGHADGG